MLLTRAGGQTTVRNIHNMTPVACVMAEHKDKPDTDELIEFLMGVNKVQDRENFKKERDANRAQREELDQLKREAYGRSAAGKKATFKEKAMKDYERWRQGGEEFKTNIEKRAENRRKKPNEFFEAKDEAWRERRPEGHSTTGGDIPAPRTNPGY